MRFKWLIAAVSHYLTFPLKFAARAARRLFPHNGQLKEISSKELASKAAADLEKFPRWKV